MTVTAKLPATKTFKRGVKVGRLPVDTEALSKVMPLGAFIDSGVKAGPPATVDYAAGAEPALKAMLGNDAQGNTSLTAVLRCQVIMTADPETGEASVPTTQEATGQYVMVCNPGDVGGSLLSVLDWWQKKGLKAGGESVKVEGFARLAPGDRKQLQLAVSALRGVVLGIQLKRSWYEDAAEGCTWDATDSPDAGPIAVAVVGYSDAGVKFAWAGITGTLTWAAYAQTGVVEEAYCVFGPEWKTGEAMEDLGWKLDALATAVEDVKAGKPPTLPAKAKEAPKAVPDAVAPTSSANFTGIGTIEMLGTKVQVPITGTLSEVPAGPATRQPDWYGTVAEATAVIHAARVRQWGLCAMHLAELFAGIDSIPADADQEQFLVDLADALDNLRTGKVSA